MRKGKGAIGILLALMFSLSACGNSGGGNAVSGGDGSVPADSDSSNTVVGTELSDEERWHGAYEETVTVSVAIPTNSAMIFEEGDSYSDNVWTRALLEERNIKVETKWEAVSGEQYDTKMNLTIASDDLPDILNLSSYSQFEKLNRAGKLEDLSGYYDSYAYPLFKEHIESDGGEVLSWGTINDRLMGISVEPVNYQQTRMIWIRADWLEESGLPEPKTIEDVITIAKAFKDADPEKRWGMPFFKTVLEDGMCDMTGISNAVGAYPRTWIDDGSGGVTYGSIQPAFKEAIQIYADLFKDGYIDPAFASLDGGKVGEQLTSNQIGVIIGNSWLSSWPLNTLYDTDQVEWKNYPLLPSEKLQGDLKVQTLEPSGKMVAVRKGYEHPDALFKWLNFNVAKVDDPATAEPRKFHSSDPAGEVVWAYHMMNPLYVYWSDPMVNFNTQPHVTKAIDTGDLSNLVTPHDETQYAAVMRYFDQEKAGEQIAGSAWAAYNDWYGDDSTFAILNSYFAKDMFLVSKLAGYQTDTMVKQWGNLKTLEDQYIVEMISGSRPIDDFDEFVSTWKAMGGDKIIEEVNEWYGNKNQ